MKAISIIVRLGIVALLLTVFVQEWERSRQRSWEEQFETDLGLLVESYRVGTLDFIDISKITPFVWEKLYLFGPYSSKERIAETIGIEQLWNLDTTIESSDSIVLFVFVNQNKIVRYINFGRGVDFSDADRESGYSPSEAKFILDERDRAIPISP